jgi:hypothetical protein
MCAILLKKISGLLANYKKKVAVERVYMHRAALILDFDKELKIVL